MTKTKDIHKGGRPPVQRPEEFYAKILEEYEVMTIGQMCEYHNVSRSTISRWLRRARGGVDAK